jgi:hypothetical protein
VTGPRSPSVQAGVPRSRLSRTVTFGRRRNRWPAALYLLLVGSLAGCGPYSGPNVSTLSPATLPPQPEFQLTASGTALPTVEVTAPPTTVIETPDVQPDFTVFCTTDALYLRSAPGSSSEQLALMGGHSQVTRIGSEEQVADGHTWYRVTYGGQQGWAAADWLSAGDCNQAVSGGETPTIIDGAYISGYGWKDTGSIGETHYAVDLQSSSGDTAIESPYVGNVTASDACSACTDQDATEGNTLGDTSSDYNYGYGAMVIVEYAYDDLSEDERTQLAADGINLESGQSLYLMMAHLDPTSVPAAGTELDRGSALADIGNSGNSNGAHTHLEAAINDSGLTQGDDQSVPVYWWNTIVERSRVGDQGNRIDPTPLLDIP